MRNASVCLVFIDSTAIKIIADLDVSSDWHF